MTSCKKIYEHIFSYFSLDPRFVLVLFSVVREDCTYTESVIRDDTDQLDQTDEWLQTFFFLLFFFFLVASLQSMEKA